MSSGDYTAEFSFDRTKMKQTFHVDLAEGLRRVAIRPQNEPMNVKNIREASDCSKYLQTTKRTQNGCDDSETGKSSRQRTGRS